MSTLEEMEGRPARTYRLGPSERAGAAAMLQSMREMCAGKEFRRGLLLFAALYPGVAVAEAVAILEGRGAVLATDPADRGAVLATVRDQGNEAKEG